MNKDVSLVDKRELFLNVIEELLWSDKSATVCSFFVHTHIVKNEYILSGRMKMYPSNAYIVQWMKAAGYTYLGSLRVRCTGTGLGTFWTKYPELFVKDGEVDRDEVERCVARRKLYLASKGRVIPGKLYSVGEASELFDVSINTIRTWDADGYLPGERTDGGHRRFNLSQLINFP